jgi:hypothetical protein
MGKNTKRIELSGKNGQGKYTIVDAEDFNWLNRWKWYVTGKGYVARTWHSPRPFRIDRTIFMHRVINNTPEEFQTDHINRDKLDNRKINLRTATNTLNQLNKGLQKNNTSGFIGISRRPNGKWWARVYIKRRAISLGCYEDIAKAVKVRESYVQG